MRISSITKNAGKACNNRLYRHIRTFKKIVKNYFVILNKSVLPVIIRADYNRDPEESELHHPYSHITLGGYKNCRIPVDRPISPMKFVKFIMEHFYYVPSSQLEFNFEIEGIVAFEEHIAEKDINKSRIIV